MANIRRSEVAEKMITGLRLDTGRDVVPTQLASKVVPTFEVSEKPRPTMRVGSRTTDGATTLHTCSTTARTFLICASLSNVQSVAGATENLSSSVTIKPYDQTSYLAVLKLDLPTNVTAQESTSISLPLPIELTKGSTINLISADGDANSISNASVIFYEIQD